MRRRAASRRHYYPDRNWHPLPPVLDRNRHPLILRTRIPCREKKTRNPSRTAGFSISHPEETDSGARPAQPEPAVSQASSGTAARAAALEHPALPDGGNPPPVPGFPGGLPAPGQPDLRNVVPEDLKDIGRLLDLYEQAVELGLVTDSEHDRLRFVAAAEHARIIGTKNPCGLFVRLVRGGLLHFVTYDDEVAASVRIRRHLYGGVPEFEAGASGRIVPASAPELSDDARLVQAVRAAAAQAGYRGDAFPLLKRQKPEWTRERWDRAVDELDGHQRRAMSRRSLGEGPFLPREMRHIGWPRSGRGRGRH